MHLYPGDTTMHPPTLKSPRATTMALVFCVFANSQPHQACWFSAVEAHQGTQAPGNRGSGTGRLVTNEFFAEQKISEYLWKKTGGPIAMAL